MLFGSTDVAEGWFSTLHLPDFQRVRFEALIVWSLSLAVFGCTRDSEHPTGIVHPQRWLVYLGGSAFTG